MSMFQTWSLNGIGKWKTKMPKFKTDVYIDGIFVKTYFVTDIDEEWAHDRALESVQEELMLDTEEIDE